MIRFILLILFSCISTYAICQNNKIDSAKLIDTTVTSRKTITIVQIPAQFPGGLPAWQKYLGDNLDRDVAKRNKAPFGKYSVSVSWIIDKEGNVTNVNAENDPGYGTKEEAVRVISQSPKWMPAKQNGRDSIYKHKQSISFIVQ